MKGVFLDSDSIDTGDISCEALRTTLPSWQFHGHTEPGQTADRIRRAAVVVSNKVMLDRDALRSARELKLICIAATGTNNVDLQAANEAGIMVCNVVHYATPSVVQHVFGLIFSLSTRLIDYHHAVQAGHWNQAMHFCLLDYPIREMSGKTIGIIGYGELGGGVARAAECFGMNVLIAQRPGSSPQAGRVALSDLLPRCDVVSLHCPLTDQTRNLIGAAELGLMKPDALLINTARGGLVDEHALAEALRTGQIGGAGVDTLTEEPPVKGNILLDANVPNLIVTPHIAWATRAARQRLVDGVTANIKAFLNNTPTNQVGQTS